MIYRLKYFSYVVVFACKLAKKFTGVINSLKDALPSFELDLSPAPNTPKSEGITPCDLKPESSFASFPFQENFSTLTHDKSLALVFAHLQILLLTYVHYVT